jgi:hypothetical protein
MPLVMLPTPMGDPTDRTTSMTQPIPATADPTTDDCDPMGPYHIADIDL